MLWGVMTACTAAVQNYRGLLSVRIFLGVFEATIGPSLMLISSQWYTKSEQAPRFSLWYLGLGLGQIVGGILSYAFQQITHEAIAGWRVMFVVLGIVTVIIGIATTIFLPDTPMKAGFLSEGEKMILLEHVSVNQTGIDNKRFQWSQVWEACRDMQIWFLVLITILVSTHSLFHWQCKSSSLCPAIRLKWCGNDLLRNSDQIPRLQLPPRRTPQHTIRHRQHLLHSPCRLWHPPHIPSLGMDRHVQHSRHHRRRIDVIPPQQQHCRPPRGHISRKRHRRPAAHHLPLDRGQLWRADEKGLRQRHRRRLVLRW